jgi:hypothetical protein
MTKIKHGKKRTPPKWDKGLQKWVEWALQPGVGYDGECHYDWQECDPQPPPPKS